MTDFTLSVKVDVSIHYIWPAFCVTAASPLSSAISDKRGNPPCFRQFQSSTK